MIEVNLLPGGKGTKRPRRRTSLSLPSLPRGFAGDRWVVGASLLVLVSLLSIGWMHTATAGEVEELEIRIEGAQRDAARFQDVIQRAEGLRARSDSIAERAHVIQEIDGNRYVWPHLLDEIARALPDHAWLSRIQQITTGEQVLFRVEGRAGTFFALASLMEAMEASPFVRGTTLMSSDRITLQGGGDRMVYSFSLEAEYRDPPPELVETEPLFGGSVAPPPVGGR